MYILKNEKVIYIDCDETLILWNYRTEFEDKTIEIGREGFKCRVLPHEPHITEIKRHKARGQSIVVWSAAGFEWATQVVQALQLEDYVDLVMSKPFAYYDDLSSQEFMGTKRYIRYGQ